MRCPENVLEVRWFSIADLGIQRIWGPSGPTLCQPIPHTSKRKNTWNWLSLSKESHNGFGLLGLPWYAQTKNHLRSARIHADLPFSRFLGFLNYPQNTFLNASTFKKYSYAVWKVGGTYLRNFVWPRMVLGKR